MNQWAMFPYKDRMEKIVAARGYKPYGWSFSKPLFREGEDQPSEEELIEMTQLAINDEIPSPPKPKTKRGAAKKKEIKGG